MMAARTVVEREWQPVLVAPFEAPFVVLSSRLNQVRAVTRAGLRALSSGSAKAQPHLNSIPTGWRALSSGSAKAQPHLNSIPTGWRALFARSLMRRRLLT
jgi:hypothetical protein